MVLSTLKVSGPILCLSAYGESATTYSNRKRGSRRVSAKFLLRLNFAGIRPQNADGPQHLRISSATANQPKDRSSRSLEYGTLLDCEFLFEVVPELFLGLSPLRPELLVKQGRHLVEGRLPNVVIVEPEHVFQEGNQ